MMMTTTTIQCEICNDKGVMYIEQWPGAYKSALCVCHSPEYWAEQSTTGMMLFRERIAEIRAKAGGNGGQMAESRGKEHQLS